MTWLGDRSIKGHNADLLSKWFKSAEEWTLEYVKSDDYLDEFGDLTDRLALEDNVRELLQDYAIPKKRFDEIANEIAERISIDQLCDSVVLEEYSLGPSGYLYSWPINEYEEEIPVDRIRDDLEDKIIGNFSDVLKEWIELQRDHQLTLVEDSAVYLTTGTFLRIDFFVDHEVLEDLLEDLLGEEV